MIEDILKKEVAKIFKRNKLTHIPGWNGVALKSKIGDQKYFIKIFPPHDNAQWLLRIDTKNQDNLFYFDCLDILLNWLHKEIKLKRHYFRQLRHAELNNEKEKVIQLQLAIFMNGKFKFGD